jgi:AcrR family transcriptional regulator
VDQAAKGQARRRQARGERRIEQLLDAAADVFAEVGYEAATTNAIAARAGVSPGTLYQFFPNKAAMAEALGDRYAAQLEAAEAAGEQSDLRPEEMVGGIMDVLIGVNLGQPGMGELLMGGKAPAHKLHALMTERLAGLLKARAPGLSEAERDRCVQVVIGIYKGMLPLIAAADPAEQVALGKELKRIVSQYLEPYW